MILRLLLGLFLLGVASLDLANGPEGLALTVIGLAVGGMLLATVAAEALWPPEHRSRPLP
jgi:hypothetical protein